MSLNKPVRVAVSLVWALVANTTRSRNVLPALKYSRSVLAELRAGCLMMCRYKTAMAAMW